MSPDQPDIFISYSTKDGAATAAKLRRFLEARRFSVWQDIVKLKGGDDWWSQIEAALRSKHLQHFVLLATPAALASKVVRDEIRLAKQEGKTVSPVRGPGFDPATAPRWLGQIYDLEKKPEHLVTFLSVLRLPSQQKRVPMMAPEPPADFVLRCEEFGALKRKLLDTKGDAVAITAALKGAGGYGKTTLAKALAHDPDIHDAYFDGILWAELGEQPGNLIGIVSGLIARLTGEPAVIATLNDAPSALAEALGERRILLIVDDAWRQQDLRLFLQGGHNATRLITTRLSEVLPVNAHKQPVDAMQPGEAQALLSSGLPLDQAAAETTNLAALATRLGKWAQLLKLANGFLRDRVVDWGEPLATALQDANERLDEEGLASFDAEKPEDRTQAIAKTIGLSLGLLDDAQRQRFAELAIFPEDVDVPLGIASALWRQTAVLSHGKAKGLLVKLAGLSLLAGLDLAKRSFRFHDTVRQFLREQILREQDGKEKLAALHKTLLAATAGLDAPGTDKASRSYYYLYRPAHLAAAGEREALDALLTDPVWLQAKLDALDNPQALITDYEQFGQGELQGLLRQTLRLSSGICARDKRQLLPQLHGRLMSAPGAAEFCNTAHQFVRRPALLTFRPSLSPPGAEVARFEGHRHEISSLAVLRDGRLTSASKDHTIRLWDTNSGVETTCIGPFSFLVEALAAMPDGRLASGCEDHNIRLWDTNTGAELARLEGHGQRVNALAVLPDGRLASASEDHTIRLWDLNTGAELVQLEGHGDAVNALVALPDGRLASGSSDKTIRLWDTTSLNYSRRLLIDAVGKRRRPD